MPTTNNRWCRGYKKWQQDQILHIHWLFHWTQGYNMQATLHKASTMTGKVLPFICRKGLYYFTFAPWPADLKEKLHISTLLTLSRQMLVLTTDWREMNRTEVQWVQEKLQYGVMEHQSQLCNPLWWFHLKLQNTSIFSKFPIKNPLLCKGQCTWLSSKDEFSFGGFHEQLMTFKL